MCIPLKPIVCYSNPSQTDGPKVVLQPMDYSEYKKREKQGQLPQLGKYVPKEPSRIEQAYAEFVNNEVTHIPYERTPGGDKYSVIRCVVYISMYCMYNIHMPSNRGDRESVVCVFVCVCHTIADMLICTCSRSSSNGGSINVGRDPGSSINKRTDYSQAGSYNGR